MKHKPIGIILTGGLSKRMGFDKSKIQLGNQTLLENHFNLLSVHCENVYSSCRKENPVENRFNPLFDLQSFEGPLNGVLTALDTFKTENILVLAVDQPFISHENILRLIHSEETPHPVSAFFNEEIKKPEPFPSYWKAGSGDLLKNYLKHHTPSTLGFMVNYGVQIISSDNLQFRINLNNPDDLKLFINNKK